MNIETKKRTLGRAAPYVAGALLLLATPALSQDVAGFAKRLSGLRSEVEALSARLASVTGDSRDTLRSLSRQKTDLELEVKKEQTRMAKVRVAVAEKKKVIEAEKTQAAELRPAFEANVVKVRGYVERSLPFRVDERLAELDKISEQFSSGLLSPPKAASRLWTFVEDELRLTKESGLYRQTIEVDGHQQLADVVRIGMVMLFYKTSTSDVGHATMRDGKWTFVSIADPLKRESIFELFDTFKKQIRQGYFVLPNALADLAPEAGAAAAPAPMPESSAQVEPTAAAGASAASAGASGSAPHAAPSAAAAQPEKEQK